MKPYLDILFITLVVVFVVDLSGFTESWLAALSRWLGRRVNSFKPFSCSLCMTWWCGLAYALITHNFTLPIIAYVAGMAFLSFPIGEILIFIRESLIKWIGNISS